MDLSIIIVNWNTRELLRQCLTSVEENVQSIRDLDVETLVVDNASTDGSTDMMREHFPWVQILENEENVGFARGNNQALHISRGRYVLLLNSDTEVLPGALETLSAFMDRHPDAGAVGPLLLNADGTLQPSCHPMLTPWREFWRLIFLDRLIQRRATYDMKHWDRTTPRPVEVIKGAAMFLRKCALDEVGFLDEQYFMYSEEMDLCHRLLSAGWQLYWVPQASVVHHGGASSAKMPEQMYVQLYRSKVQFHRKFGGERRARLMKALLAVAYLPRWAITGPGASVRSAWRPRAQTYRRLLRELPRM
jgi:GT2 family glycosyltransferase